MTLTRNLALDRLRAAGRNHQQIETAMWLEAEQDSPLKLTERADAFKYIGKLIERLPEKQQEVLRLRDMEGFSYEEISGIMAIDLNQVKVNLHRARKFLKENLLRINDYGLEVRKAIR